MFLMFMLSIAAIGFFCWLLFTIAVFALPFFAGVSAASWAYHTGAGWLGAILVGIVAAALTLGFGQVLLAVVRPLWGKLAIATVFVAPAVIAVYRSTPTRVRSRRSNVMNERPVSRNGKMSFTVHKWVFVTEG